MVRDDQRLDGLARITAARRDGLVGGGSSWSASDCGLGAARSRLELLRGLQFAL